MEADLPNPLGQALLSWFDCLMEGQARMEKPLGTAICNGVQSLGAHLLHIIETQALRGDLPEALASLFCLKEFLVRLCFESLCHVWAGDLRGQNANSISAVEEACRKLGSPRQPNSPLTLETIRLALEKAMPDNPLHVWVHRLYQPGPNGQSLMEIRHKSRVAHGHCAVALDAPELSGWPGGWNEVMESARQTAQSVLGFLPVSPYEAAFEYIVSECRPIWINHHEDAYFKT
ncbi:MAG: hypothetical protein QMD09_10680 [Desulfatibacillaceae bacterium]|nr:hypothetical protein [Desulfatibacillaceae bacterium]